MNFNNLNNYINKIKNIPMLSKEEEHKLISEYKASKNPQVQKKIVTSYLKLSLSMALKYAKFNNKISAIDLIAEANLGLIYGLQKFDTVHNTTLATYLMLWIRAYIHNYLFKNHSIVNSIKTTNQKKLFFSWNKIRNKILNTSCKDEINNQDLVAISKDINVPVKDIQSFIRSNANIDHTLVENITHSNELIPDEKANILHQKTMIINALKSVKDRERKIFLCRYYINLEPNSEDLSIEKKETIKNIAKEFKISGERIRQIIEQTIKNIKTFITKQYNAIASNQSAYQLT